MPNDPSRPAATHKTRGSGPLWRRDVWTSRLAGLALVPTLLVLAALIGLKIATNADWRAVTMTSFHVCARQESAPDSSDPLPAAGHLVDCVARRNPVRNEPIELITLAGLSTLAAVEVGCLTRNH